MTERQTTDNPPRCRRETTSRKDYTFVGYKLKPYQFSVNVLSRHCIHRFIIVDHTSGIYPIRLHILKEPWGTIWNLKLQGFPGNSALLRILVLSIERLWNVCNVSSSPCSRHAWNASTAFILLSLSRLIRHHPRLIVLNIIMPILRYLQRRVLELYFPSQYEISAACSDASAASSKVNLVSLAMQNLVIRKVGHNVSMRESVHDPYIIYVQQTLCTGQSFPSQQ